MKKEKAKILQKRKTKEMHIPAYRWTLKGEQSTIAFMEKHGYTFLEKKYAGKCEGCGKVTLVFKQP